MDKEELKRGDIIYYARIIPNLGIYDICEIILRTVEDTWIAGMDKNDKKAYIFSKHDMGHTIFLSRKNALAKVKEAEQSKPTIDTETYYEEY